MLHCNLDFVGFGIGKGLTPQLDSLYFFCVSTEYFVQIGQAVLLGEKTQMWQCSCFQATDEVTLCLHTTVVHMEPENTYR